MGSTRGVAARTATLAAIALAASACATRLPLVRVSEQEASAALADARTLSQTEIAIDANRRYFEIFLADPIVQRSLGPEQRQAFASTGRADLIDALRSTTEREWGTDPLTVSRASPGMLRALGAREPWRGLELHRIASSVESIQAPVLRKIDEVGRRVLEAGGRSDIRILVDAEVGMNAFVPVEFGSNRLFVGPELALHTRSDDELACVMGHELAHITEGHTTSGAWANVGKMTLTVLVATAVLAAATQGNQGASLTQQQVDGALALGQITTLLLAEVPLRLSGWQRDQEREADAMGLWYANRAGYDADACASFMLHMTELEAASGESDGPRWWAVHPPTAERVVAFRWLAAEVEAGRLRPAE
jgi:hypothetical protein